MRRPRPRPVRQRLCPRTLRVRITLMVACVTLVPLALYALADRITVRSGLLEGARRPTSSPISPRTHFEPARLSLPPWSGAPASQHPGARSGSRAHQGPSLPVRHVRADTVLRSLVPGALGLTLLVTAGTWLLAGRWLRPLESLRSGFAGLGARHLHRRVPVPRSGCEIARLATTVNDTLGRLEAEADQQRSFVADASHELRTPLAALHMELELALRGTENIPWRQVVTNALGDTLRLQHLTTELLLLARLDALTGDAGPPGNRVIDMADLVREELGRRRTPSRLALVSRIEQQPVLVQGSRGLLARVLGNLLDNAERHATTTVTVHLAPGPGRRTLTLEVRDDGPGVPPDDQARIFERFTRLEEARARDTGGAGLGLAIAHRITALHQGTLTLSPEASGAHFTVRLPTAHGKQWQVTDSPEFADAAPGGVGGGVGGGAEGGVGGGWRHTGDHDFGEAFEPSGPAW
ncbi:HAMP domain-containing sensor histidine kinase [Streptomyces sp. NPDC059900]|uniref:sensor histidine kinase n=1 Tax=Streptomyces sp. NPDC059900 TaxID=3155816 RepID=UPI00343F1FC6